MAGTIELNPSTSHRTILTQFFTPEDLAQCVKELAGRDKYESVIKAYKRMHVVRTDIELVDMRTKDAENLVWVAVCERSHARFQELWKTTQALIDSESDTKYIAHKLLQMAQSCGAQPRDLIVCTRIYCEKNSGKMAPALREASRWQADPKYNGLPQSIAALSFSKASPLTSAHELFYQKLSQDPVAGERSLMDMIKGLSGQEHQPFVRGFRFLQGMASAIQAKPLPEPHPWAAGGRLYGLCPQKAAQAIEELALPTIKPLVKQFFADADAAALIAPLAEFLVPHIAHVRKVTLLLDVLPSKYWQAYRAELRDTVKADIEKHLLLGRVAKARELVESVLRDQTDWRYYQVRLLRMEGRFEEAQKLNQANEYAFESILCEAKIAQPLTLEIKGDNSMPEELGQIYELDSQADDVERSFVELVLGLDDPGLEVGLCGPSFPDTRELLRQVEFEGSGEITKKVVAYAWLASLFRDDFDLEEVQEHTQRLAQMPEVLAYLPTGLIVKGLRVLHLYPEGTEFLSGFIEEHLPQLLDSFIQPTELLEHPAMRQRMLEVAMDAKTPVTRWAGFEQTIQRANAAGDKALVLDALEVCYSAAKEDSRFKPFFLELLDQLPELPEPWAIRDVTIIKAELLLELGRRDEGSSLFYGIISQDLGNQRTARMPVLLEQAREAAGGVLPEMLQEFKARAHVTKQPSAEMVRVPAKTVKVLFLGGSENESKRTSQMQQQGDFQKAIPLASVEFDHTLWSDHSKVDRLLNKLVLYDVIVLSPLMRTITGYRIRQRLRSLKKTYYRCLCCGRETILSSIFEAVQKHLKAEEATEKPELARAA